MKRFLSIMAVVFAATVVQAQKNVKKAMDDLIGDKSVVTVMTNKYEHDGDGTDATYCHYTVLQIDKKQASKIDRLQDAFVKDAQYAYRSIYQTPKQYAQQVNVVYGPDLEYSIKFCTRRDHNYRLLFVHDSDNKDKRYVYAMVWYKEGDGLRCLLYRIYGKNPAKVSKKLSELSKTSLGSLDGIVIDGDRWQIVDSDNILITTGGTNKKRASANDNGNGTIENDSDFMMCFGCLRAAFLDAIKDSERKALHTGIAVKILTLCKEHGGLLSENERVTCERSLMEMKRALLKTGSDTFLGGLLDEAVLALKK